MREDAGVAAGRGFAAVALAFTAAVQLYMLPSGFFLDDLAEAAAGRGASAAEIARLEPAPSLLPLFLWKAATALDPEEPFVPMRVAYAALHVANAALLFLLFRPLLGSAVAWISAGAFLLFRPSDTAVLWVSAGKETLLLFLSLLSLLAWRRGARWLALAPATLAMASKPSVILLPAVLAAYSHWLEPREPGRPLPRGTAAPLAVLVAIHALLAWNALVRPGWWGVFEPGGGASTAGKLALLAKSLLREFSLVWPDRALPGALSAWVAAAALAAAFAFLGDRVRFGLFTAAAFLAPPIFAAGITSPHYGYVAGAGALFALAAAIAPALSRPGRSRRLAACGIAAFSLANAVLFTRDARAHHACNALNVATRERLAERSDALCPGCEVRVVNRSVWVGIPEIARYDHGVEITAVRAASCAEPGADDCIHFRWTVNGAAQCPRAEVASFVRWVHPD